MTMRAESLFTIRRFGLRLGCVILFALIQIATPWGFTKALQLMLGFTGIICAGIALTKRERFTLRALGNWDEAIVFLVLCGCFHLVAFHLLRY